MEQFQVLVDKNLYQSNFKYFTVILTWYTNPNDGYNAETSSVRVTVKWLFGNIIKDFKTESARRWSNKWTKTLYQDYLHCIANFGRALLIIFSKQFISSNTKRRKRKLNFV